MNAGRIVRIIGAVFCIALVSGMGVQNARAVLVTIGQWDFESLTGGYGSTPDSSGNGNDLNVYGPDPVTLDPNSQSGSSSLSLPGGPIGSSTLMFRSNLAHSDLSTGQNFMMTAWVNTLGFDPVSSGIMFVGDSFGSPGQPFFTLNVLGDGSSRLWGNVWDGSPHDLVPAAIPANQLQGGWNQVGMSYSNGTFAIYLGGNEVASYYSGVTLPSQNVIVQVGAGAYANNNWHGLIDNVTLTTAIPEPSMVALLGLGGVTMLWRQRRRQ